MSCESVMEDATRDGCFPDSGDSAVDEGNSRIFKSCFIVNTSGRNVQIARIVYIFSGRTLEHKSSLIVFFNYKIGFLS